MENQQNMDMKIQKLNDEIENLKADIAVLKLRVPPPVGFTSWEQFDRVTQDAYENQ